MMAMSCEEVRRRRLREREELKAELVRRLYVDAPSLLSAAQARQTVEWFFTNAWVQRRPEWMKD
jgi:molybdenum cofactor biosynthesis enzyme MoaA